MAKAIGKITAKAIIGEFLMGIAKNTAMAKAEGKTYSFDRVEAMRIQGRVDKVKVAPSGLNPENIDVKLMGEFIATNCFTGDQYQSATLYAIGSAMAELMAQSVPGSMFAISVFVTPSSKSVQGYCFEFESALEVAPSDVVAGLGNAFKALPAPKKADEHKKPEETNHPNHPKKK